MFAARPVDADSPSGCAAPLRNCANRAGLFFLHRRSLQEELSRYGVALDRKKHGPVFVRRKLARKAGDRPDEAFSNVDVVAFLQDSPGHL